MFLLVGQAIQLSRRPTHGDPKPLLSMGGEGGEGQRRLVEARAASPALSGAHNSSRGRLKCGRSVACLPFSPSLPAQARPHPVRHRDSLTTTSSIITTSTTLLQLLGR